MISPPLLNELSYLGMDDGFMGYREGYEHALLLPYGTPVLRNVQTLTQLLSQHLVTNSCDQVSSLLYSLYFVQGLTRFSAFLC